jgi:O-antigen/teichoic acid export membrane protein
MLGIINQAKDPLYKNSFFIMLTSLSSAGFGFIFWILAAKLYPKGDVGVATALISSMNLLILLTRFGLDSSIIRFYPQNDKSSIFSTSTIITTVFTVLTGIIFILGIDIWSPELKVLSSLQNTILYIIFLAASSIISMASSSYYALRRAELGFYQSLIVGSRVVALFPLVFLGTMGIYGAVGISFILAGIFSFASLTISGITPVLRLDRRFLNEAFHFSAGNYIAGLLIAAPAQILPIIVLNILGSEETAHYYIAFSITSLLFMVPTALSTSLFVEGSHGEGLKKSTIKSTRAVFLLLIPLSIFLYFAGGWILGFIGKDYAASGLELLRAMTVSSFFMAVFYIYSSIKKIQKDIKGLILLNGLIFGLLIGLGYVFMLQFGIIGMGYAYIAAYGIGALAVLAIAVKEKWIRLGFRR